MRVVITRTAEEDLHDIFHYIAKDNKEAASQTFESILNKLSILSEFPEAGKIGKLPETRELLFSGTPYYAIYKITPHATIDIIHVYHGAMQR